MGRSHWNAALLLLSSLSALIAIVEGSGGTTFAIEEVQRQAVDEVKGMMHRRENLLQLIDDTQSDLLSAQVEYNDAVRVYAVAKRVLKEKEEAENDRQNELYHIEDVVRRIGVALSNATSRFEVCARNLAVSLPETPAGTCEACAEVEGWCGPHPLPTFTPDVPLGDVMWWEGQKERVSNNYSNPSLPHPFSFRPNSLWEDVELDESTLRLLSASQIEAILDESLPPAAFQPFEWGPCYCDGLYNSTMMRLDQHRSTTRDLEGIVATAGPQKEIDLTRERIRVLVKHYEKKMDITYATIERHQLYLNDVRSTYNQSIEYLANVTKPALAVAQVELRYAREQYANATYEMDQAAKLTATLATQLTTYQQEFSSSKGADLDYLSDMQHKLEELEVALTAQNITAGFALSFQGGAKLETEPLVLPPQFTFEVWVEYHPDESETAPIFNIIDVGSSRVKCSIYLEELEGSRDVYTGGKRRWNVAVFLRSGVEECRVYSNYSEFDNWHHVAVAMSASSLSLMLDGVTAMTSSCSGMHVAGNVYMTAMEGAEKPTGEARIGEGVIDEMRLWSVARNAGDVKGGMLSSLPVTSRPFLFYYMMNEHYRDDMKVPDHSPFRHDAFLDEGIDASVSYVQSRAFDLVEREERMGMDGYTLYSTVDEPSSLSFPSLSSLGDEWTVEMIITPDSNMRKAELPYLVQQDMSLPPSTPFLLEMKEVEGEEGKYEWVMRVNTTAKMTTLRVPARQGAQHVAVGISRNGDVYLYGGGTVDVTKLRGLTRIVEEGGEYLEFGRMLNEDGVFRNMKAKLSELRVWSTFRTIDQISAFAGSLLDTSFTKGENSKLVGLFRPGVALKNGATSIFNLIASKYGDGELRQRDNAWR